VSPLYVAVMLALAVKLVVRLAVAEAKAPLAIEKPVPVTVTGLRIAVPLLKNVTVPVGAAP
jgi:hypothetical protein